MFQIRTKPEYKNMQPYCSLIFDIFSEIGDVYMHGGSCSIYNHYGQLYNTIIDELNKYTPFSFSKLSGVK